MNRPALLIYPYLYLYLYLYYESILDLLASFTVSEFILFL